MQVIAHREGSWFLFSEADRYLISVVCGRVGEWLEEFVLSEADAQRVVDGGEVAVDQFAKEVAANPSAFQNRERVKLAGTEFVRRALERWRSQPS